MGHIKSQCRSKSKKHFEESRYANNGEAKTNESLCAFEDIKACGTSASTVTQTSCCMSFHAQQNNGDGDCLPRLSCYNLVNNKNVFNTLKQMNPVSINVAKKGTSLIAKEYGDITVKIFNPNKNESSKKTIERALYVENLKCNLLSIGKLTEKGYVIRFENDSAHITYDGETHFMAHRNGNLYEVRFHVERNVFAGIAGEDNLNKLSQSLWHFRLAHLNTFDMKKLIEDKMVDGFDKIAVDTDTKFCESCVMGKQARLPFNKRNVQQSQRVLELTHTGVCGPMKNPA